MERRGNDYEEEEEEKVGAMYHCQIPRPEPQEKRRTILFVRRARCMIFGL
jgi:hypothetical protein